MSNNESYICQCECGLSKFTLSKTPKARFLCHCVTCQEVYGKPFADVVGVRSSAVSLVENKHIIYKKFSPALERGVCTECNSPIISFLTMSSFFNLKVAFIPLARLNKQVVVPDAQAHIYYHSCTNSVVDDLPKVSGKFKSTMRAMPIIMRALFSK